VKNAIIVSLVVAFVAAAFFLFRDREDASREGPTPPEIPDGVHAHGTNLVSPEFIPDDLREAYSVDGVLVLSGQLAHAEDEVSFMKEYRDFGSLEIAKELDARSLEHKEAYEKIFDEKFAQGDFEVRGPIYEDVGDGRGVVARQGFTGDDVLHGPAQARPGLNGDAYVMGMGEEEYPEFQHLHDRVKWLKFRRDFLVAQERMNSLGR